MKNLKLINYYYKNCQNSLMMGSILNSLQCVYCFQSNKALPQKESDRLDCMIKYFKTQYEKPDFRNQNQKIIQSNNKYQKMNKLPIQVYQPSEKNIINEPLQTEEDSVNLEKQRFCELLKKLVELTNIVHTHSKFQTYYKTIGLERQTVVKGLTAIYEYFIILGEEIDKGVIKKQIGNRLVEYVHEYLQMEKFEQLNSKNKAVYILQFQTKFSVCLQFFQSIKHQESNITNQPVQKYENVWKEIQKVSVGDKLQIQKKYNFVKKMMIITTTAILAEEQIEWSMIKKVFFGLAYPRYMMDYATARLKSFIFYKYPTVKLAKQIWNIPEFGASKQFIKMAFENIVINQKIYIPFQCEEDEYPDIYSPNQNAIQVRILHHEPLRFRKKIKSKINVMCCTQDMENDYKQIDSIIVHMHGGGFIALSSRMMQTMTRRWANKLKIPIFSIDYRKPPTHPFPAAPMDCLAVYKFIVTKIRKYMNINPKNIYLVGDSAGGNLACSLMGNILKNNLLIPKGMYIAYPATDLRVRFSPSRVHAVTDPLLWPSMLLLCLKEYLNNNVELSLDPLASPILLTEEYVGGQAGDKRFPLKWPKTMIVVGQKDPLYDDSLMLMQKMKQSNIQCKCRVYEQFSHGFLSTNFMISECERTLLDSINDLKQLTGLGQPIQPKMSTSSKKNKKDKLKQ